MRALNRLGSALAIGVALVALTAGSASAQSGRYHSPRGGRHHGPNQPQVIARPQHRYTRSLIEAAPELGRHA